MKKTISAALVASCLTLLCPSAFAQWDNRQDLEWNIIESRMERRRMEERMKARREVEKKQRAKTAGSRAGKTAASAKRVVSTKKVVAPVKSYGVWFYHDTFAGFALQSGYRANITFVSTTTGKVFPRFAYYDIWNTDGRVFDVPAGTYTIKAQAIQKGKKYPVQFAVRTTEADDEAPIGPFTSSLKIQLKPIVTIGGKFVPDDDPLKIYVRVIQ